MIKIKKIKPMFTCIITTMNKYEDDCYTEGGVIDLSKQKGAIKEYQTVLAIGSTVRDIKVGDLVLINPERFAVKKHNAGSLKDGIIKDNPTISYNFDIMELGDKQCLLLQDRDIHFIIEEYEDIPDPKPSSIITPPKKEIIV